MALLFMDGFDCYATAAQAGDGGWQPENSPTCLFSTTGGRYGGGAIYWTTTIYQWIKTVPLVAYGSTIYVGFAYKHGGLATTALLYGKSDASASIFGLSHDAAGALTFIPNSGANISEAGTSLTPGTWHWIEIKVTLGTTASNGAVEVRVNGSVVITGSSIDTNTTGAGCGSIEIGGAGSGGSPAYVDDVVVFDGSGATINNFLGDTKITTHAANADAATVDWTASAGADYQCVDDTPNAANDDTDYISSSTAAQESRFGMGNLATAPATIHAVQARYRAKKTDAGTRTMRGLIKSGGVESTGTTLGLSTAYRWSYGDFFPLDPNGSIAWTDTAVNALEVGVEVVS